jgi:hypothetical protein
MSGSSLSVQSAGKVGVSGKLSKVIKSLVGSKAAGDKDVMKAVADLEKIVPLTEKKKREPSAFNKFVSKRVKEMESVKMSAQEKFKMAVDQWKTESSTDTKPPKKSVKKSA